MKMIDRVEVLYERLVCVDREYADFTLAFEERQFLGLRGYTLCMKLLRLLDGMRSKRAEDITRHVIDMAYDYTVYGGDL